MPPLPLPWPDGAPHRNAWLLASSPGRGATPVFEWLKFRIDRATYVDAVTIGREGHAPRNRRDRLDHPLDHPEAEAHDSCCAISASLTASASGLRRALNARHASEPGFAAC